MDTTLLVSVASFKASALCTALTRLPREEQILAQYLLCHKATSTKTIVDAEDAQRPEKLLERLLTLSDDEVSVLARSEVGTDRWQRVIMVTIQAIAAHSGPSVEKLSLVTGIPLEYLIDLFAGRVRPAPFALRRIAEAFGIDEIDPKIIGCAGRHKMDFQSCKAENLSPELLVSFGIDDRHRT